MNKTITPNDLVLFAYNELEEPRKTLVINAISVDADLARELDEIIELQDIMDVDMLSPNPTSLQIILEESSSAMEVH